MGEKGRLRYVEGILFHLCNVACAVPSGPHQKRLLAILYPSFRGEVGGLRTVETMVETSMIGVGESDHELTGFLCDLQRSSKKNSNCS